MKIPKSETTTYAQMGMAAMLPGLVHAHEVLGAEIARIRAELAVMQNGDRSSLTVDEAVAQSSSIGYNERQEEARKSGWSADPAERSAEMKRRLKVARLRKAAKERWEAMGPRQRKAHLAKMRAARWAKKEANA